GFKEGFDPTDIDGCLGSFSQSNGLWSLFMKDRQYIDQLMNKVLVEAYKGLYIINEFPYPESAEFPNIDNIYNKKFKIDEPDSWFQIYFDDRDVITYVSSKKKWIAKLSEVKSNLAVTIGNSKEYEILRWIIPEIVQDRAYKRKNLFRYATQYFLTTLYMVVYMAIVGYLSESLFDGEPPILMMLLMLPIIFFVVLSILSFFVSLIYFFRGLFTRKQLLKPGI
ncbi:MAG: hypothetical protein ABIJ45_08275, partial [Candidatus Zixiibacteriota bacterium]